MAYRWTILFGVAGGVIAYVATALAMGPIRELAELGVREAIVFRWVAILALVALAALLGVIEDAKQVDE